MRIDSTRFSADELIVFNAYDYLCVLCGFQYADTLHHEPPRSLNPRWIDEPWTQFPLCNEHHNAIQDMSRDHAKELLLAHVDIFFSGVIERIKESMNVTE